MGKRKFKRLEKGFGSVVFLGEGRRRPYAARLSASRTATGQNTPRAIGYFETWQKAYDALAEYNRLHGDGLDDQMTFDDVYNLLISRKEKRPQGLSDGLRAAFRTAHNRSEPFWSRRFAEIKVKDYQAHLDSQCGTISTSVLQQVKGLWVQMGKLGEELDIIPKNYAAFVEINQADADEHSETFTEEEVTKLWAHSEEDNAAMLLIMIYSGFRISEYETIETNLANLTLKGGIKTQAGKGRIVPIHSRIVPLVARLLASGGYLPGGQQTFRRRMRSTLSTCGIDPKKHTPHDCRATFASRLYAAGVPDLHIKRMMGHSTGDLTKDVYTEIFINELRKSLEKIK